MPAPENQRAVQLRHAVESPGRFADGVHNRYRRSAGRIAAATRTVLDRAVRGRLEHHHHAQITASTRWQPSFVVNATANLPAQHILRVATADGPPTSRPGIATSAARPTLAIAATRPAPGGRAPRTPGHEPDLHLRQHRLDPTPGRVDDVRTTTAVRRSETVLARLHHVADDQRAPATPAHAAATAGSLATWPATPSMAALPLPVPSAEVDRITRQVIDTIDHRLSAYRERQGRG